MEYPAAEDALARGDVADARDCMAVDRPLPEIRRADNLAIEVWGDLACGFGGGFDLVLAKCRAYGLGEDAALEVWHRARLAHQTARQWRADMAAARQALVQGLTDG